MNKATLTIISGGQTGVDRAALDFAIANRIPHGGWCPRGRIAEDGRIHARYCLQETPSSSYAQRTEWNVCDADATLIFSPTRRTSGGTRLTIDFAERAKKPLLQLTGKESTEASAAALRGFLDVYRVRSLNIAGPRDSQAPRIGELVDAVLGLALDRAVAAL